MGEKLVVEGVGAVKHGFEIMGLALIDIDSHNCMMLRAHHTRSNFELKKRNMTLANHYIAVIKRYRKELLKLHTRLHLTKHVHDGIDGSNCTIAE